MSLIDQERGALSRRLFVSKVGAVGIGALGATTLLAACGGDRQSTVTGGLNINLAQIAQAFRDVRRHEDDHVVFLRTALGAAARPVPTFSDAVLTSPDLNTFLGQSQALENTGVGAYLGAAPLIQSKDFLAAAASIMTVEARHAGFINVLTNNPILTNPQPGSRDTPLSQAQVVAAAGPFFVNANLNGGAAPNAALNNDIDILNFALLLEHLEARFYDLNVPRFFG